jgi:hypothetical protein
MVCEKNNTSNFKGTNWVLKQIVPTDCTVGENTGCTVRKNILAVLSGKMAEIILAALY